MVELQVLSIIRNRTEYLKYSKILNMDFFKSSETRTIYETILNYHAKVKGRFLSLKELYMLLEKEVEEEELPIFHKMLVRMKKNEDYDDNLIRHIILKFTRESMLKQALEATVGNLSKDQEVKLIELKNKLNQIISMDGKPITPDYDYMSLHEDRIIPSKDVIRIPTGLSNELDHHLKGGLGQGELGFILAPPGRGKTLALVNIGAMALRHGKKVLHITMEIKARIVAKRYDCCLTDASTDDILDNPLLLANRLKEIQKTGGKLIIKDYSYSHCGIGDLNSVLESHKEDDGLLFDLLIIDYADLMIPPQQYKDTRHEATKIYEELRIIAGAYNIPVWTASQSNRASLNKRIIKMDDIAEAFTKAAIADLILGLCQTDDEKQEKRMRIFVAKSRMSSLNPIVNVVADPDRMLMRSFHSFNGIAEGMERKIHAIRQSKK